MSTLTNTKIETGYAGLALLGLDQAEVRVLVVGLGVTGFSVVKFLSANKIKVAVVDSRAEPPALDIVENDFKEVAVFTGGFSAAAFEAATHIIVSPGIGLDEPLIAQASERGIPVFGDIDIFAVCANAPIACITGSNGKSTVTTLLGEMAKKAEIAVHIGGNLGVPALDLLDDKAALYVVELSSFQLERTSYLNASASTILNISADHMDRYASILSYTQAKARVLHGDGVKVLNRQDNAVIRLLDEAECVSFGLDEPSKGDATSYGLTMRSAEHHLSTGRRVGLPISALKIKGTHNVANALAAMALADALGISIEAQDTALKDFAGLEHRMQWLQADKGITWINDSKATNVGACLAAIKGLGGSIILIAGGDGKGASFNLLKEAVREKVSQLILIGMDAERFKAQVAFDTPCELVSSIEAAVQLASAKARAGDTVLLSPACASLDQFANYQERGERFQAALKGLEA